MDEVAKLRAEVLKNDISNISSEEQNSALKDLANRLENNQLFVNIERNLYIASYVRAQRIILQFYVKTIKLQNKENWFFGIIIGLQILGFLDSYETLYLVSTVFFIGLYFLCRKINNGNTASSLNENIAEHLATVEYFYNQGSRGIVEKPPMSTNIYDDSGYSTKDNNDLGFDVPPQD